MYDNLTAHTCTLLRKIWKHISVDRRWGFCWMHVARNFPDEIMFLGDLGVDTPTTDPSGLQELLVVAAGGVEP